VSTEVRPRRTVRPSLVPPTESPPPGPPEAGPEAKPSKPLEKRPFLLDFFPLETADQTRLHRFYERLREGRLSTTRCRRDGELLWPPRTSCPKCHLEELDWVDLPETGRVYAFSAVLAGAPLGLEADVPFAVGLVDLDGVPLRLFGRIEGRPWTELRIGQSVRAESYDIGDGRVFYRFRTVG
jgi:uncharacterized OB-fold protein